MIQFGQNAKARSYMETKKFRRGLKVLFNSRFTAQTLNATKLLVQL